MDSSELNVYLNTIKGIEHTVVCKATELQAKDDENWVTFENAAEHLRKAIKEITDGVEILEEQENNAIAAHLNALP
jgi:hypothetical protein